MSWSREDDLLSGQPIVCFPNRAGEITDGPSGLKVLCYFADTTYVQVAHEARVHLALRGFPDWRRLPLFRAIYIMQVYLMHVHAAC